MNKLIIAAVFAISITLLPASVSHGDEALARSKGCLSCHSIDKKILGPAYRDVAAKYANHNEVVGQLVEKVRKGCVGSWGAIPMPPAPVSVDEATNLVHWILKGG